MPTRREALKMIGTTAGSILFVGCTPVPVLTPIIKITPSPQPTAATATLPPTAPPQPSDTPQPTSTPQPTALTDAKFFDDFSDTKAFWNGPTWSDATGKAVNTAGAGFSNLFRWLPSTMVEDLGLKCSFDLAAGPQYGVAARWNSGVHPTSGIAAYYSYSEGHKLFIDQWIDGARSNLSAKTMMPAAVHSLYLEVNGTTANIYYNQTLLDTVTIHESFVGNENNGLFSTAPEADFTAFSLWSHRSTRMLILGDSIAAADFGFSYRAPWAYPGLVTVSNRAVVSATFVPDGKHSNLKEQVAAAASDNADIVLINLGVNDISSPAAVRSELEKQIGILKSSNPDAKLYMLRILPKTVDDNLQNAKRTAISAGCAAAGVTCWDTSDWIDPAKDTGDGLHPNVRGHEKITKRIMALLPL
jgi:hypothetical protein